MPLLSGYPLDDSALWRIHDLTRENKRQRMATILFGDNGQRLHLNSAQMWILQKMLHLSKYAANMQQYAAAPAL